MGADQLVSHPSNPAGVNADLTSKVRSIGSIAHQAAGHGELAILVDRGHPMPDGQLSEVFLLSIEE